ncbi:MAG: putative quinol monooxygenase [Desulfoprunum sp.]|jgi:quinol monooxygenase YgiN|uniref:putative quinol monooxygenase n=1 Tax=Desulfoprunum sp. TaxID=2020866 RepID=UPI00052DACCA|nr:antibiotic biosynthesis monooxygenase [Desulfobulbus sp. Tol-SR]
MITVIASITVRQQRKDEFIAIFNANVPAVRAEAGCIEYYPAIDIDTGVARQSLDHNLITIVEKWRDVEAWKDHLATPHLRAYHQQVKDLVEGVTLKVLQAV